MIAGAIAEAASKVRPTFGRWTKTHAKRWLRIGHGVVWRLTLAASLGLLITAFAGRRWLITAATHSLVCEEGVWKGRRTPRRQSRCELSAV
jgi:hypothetical protein